VGGRCENNLPRLTLKSECCCSIGLAWGSPCEICHGLCDCPKGYAKVSTHMWLSLANMVVCCILRVIYFFFFCLFNDAFSSSDYIASNERMIVHNELEKMWKEEVVA
jgi:hypothetical protein